MALDDFKSRVDALKAFDFGDELEGIVERNKSTIADLQAEQWAKGKRSDGNDINPQYSPFTIAYKKQFGVGLGRITDHVTFYQTGELYKSLYAAVNNRQFSIESDNFKFDKAKKRSGEKIVGLNQESKVTFAENITLPEIKKVLKDKTGFEIS
jgi:hypothetical protein